MQFEKYSTDHPSGKLFVFEGSDGVGKSTVVEKVAKNLFERGTDVLHLSFPGRKPKSLGKLVYELHHDVTSFGIDRISPTSLQVLHIAAHIDCIEDQIIPALSTNKTVLLDRYWWSTVAYSMAAGIPKNFIDAMVALEMMAWGKVKPEKLFLITRSAPFRAELSNELWSRVCNAYNILAHKEKAQIPIHVIENTQPLSDIVDSIITHIYNGSPPDCKNRQFKQESAPLFFLQQAQVKQRKRDRWAPIKRTEVFDTYWRFATERQSIFFKRLKGDKLPWTRDHILTDYKFTNAYRASDRVSQFLIRHVIYEGSQDPVEIFFRTILFKTFNRIETWKLLNEEIGQISWKEYDFRIYDKVLTRAQQNKKKIYSAAYIMPSGGRSFGHRVKHRNHLNLLERMMEDALPDRICDAKSMHDVFELLRGYPMIGDFLAYQYAIDINYSVLTNFSEMSFVMPGPGAKDGIKKCFLDFGGLSEVDLIKLMADRQEDEFERLGLKFQNLWGRPLQLIDCQNLFCEVDKYARIAHPEAKGVNGRSRIKQKFRPSPDPIEYFYPPKWNLNEAVKKTQFEE